MHVSVLQLLMQLQIIKQSCRFANKVVEMLVPCLLALPLPIKLNKVLGYCPFPQVSLLLLTHNFAAFISLVANL